MDLSSIVQGFVFVFGRMLDARGNLDLESPEELITSSGTPGPRARFPGPWPLRAYSFLALNFCIIFRDVFLYCFFMFFDGFRLPFWRHVGVIFHVFCITFSSIDFRRNCIQFCKDLYVFFEVFLLISMVLHPIGEASKTIVFTLLLHSLHFRKHMFFYCFRDMFRCSLFAPFVVIFCTNVGAFWHDFGIKTEVFSTPNF